MTREIVLDTETTGFDPYSGDRIVEIGCIELKNHIPTGDSFHVYINPERDMPESAFKVHGLSTDFLSQQPVMKGVIDDFVEYIEDSPLIIHNAKFDMKFLNAELEWHDRAILPMGRAIDTLIMARKMFPGSPASLDALCKRFEIDNSGRHKHGALIDSELLAAVYLELIGGRQKKFSFGTEQTTAIHEITPTTEASPQLSRRKQRPARSFTLSEEEKKAHEELVAKLKDPLWKAAG